MKTYSLKYKLQVIANMIVQLYYKSSNVITVLFLNKINAINPKAIHCSTQGRARKLSCNTAKSELNVETRLVISKGTFMGGIQAERHAESLRR